MPPKDLVLGTVQLGARYGIANKTGMPGEKEAIKILQAASDADIGAIDTAGTYGESERRIGKAFAERPFTGATITKYRPDRYLEGAEPEGGIKADVEREIAKACHDLRQSTLDCVLFHRAEHITAFGGGALAAMKDLMAEGRIRRIGLSAQTVEDAQLGLDTAEISHIQLAVNPLDWRWREAGIDEALKKRPDVTIHARSIYLQGLLASGDPSLFPEIEAVNAETIVRTLEALKTELHRQSLADLCIAYVRGLCWVDGLVIGMETIKQLEDNLELFEAPPLTPDEIGRVEEALPRVPEELLNPALWPNKV